LSRPKVSIVIPTYNRTDFLKRALKSVLEQSFQNYEVLVVDDCSRENVQEVLKELKDNRLRYLRHETNQGEAISRNTAIQAAQGEYIAFLDDDDEWMPEKLELQIDFMDKAPESTGAVYSEFLWMNSEDGRFLGRRKIPMKNGHIPTGKEEVYKILLVRNLIGTPSTVVLRKSCFKEIGFFDSQIAYGVDHDLWIRLARHYSLEYINRALVKCYVHPERLSNKLEVVMRGQQDMMVKYPTSRPEHREYHSRRYSTLGERLCLNGEMEKGRKMFVDSIRLFPSNWRSYLNLFFTFFGHSVYSRWQKVRRRAGHQVRLRGKKS